MKGNNLLNVFLAILVIVGVYYTYLGGFRAIEFSEVPYSELNAIVVDYDGYYLSSFGVKAVKDHLNNYSVEGYREVKLFPSGDSVFGSGEYLSGIILDRVELPKIPKSINYTIVTIPKKDYLVSEFSLRNRLSTIIASYRINSFIDEELLRRNATSESTIQIYDTVNQKMIYLFELEY